MPRRQRDLDVPLVDRGDSAENANGVTHAGGGVSPEAQAGIYARITFSWMSRLIAAGYSREVQRSRNDNASASLVESSEPQALTEADLYDLRPDDAPEVLRQRATTAWEAEMEKDESQRSLRRALTVAFGSTFFFAGCFKFVYDSLQMAGPLILKQFLGYLHRCDTGAANSDACEASHGLLLVGGMLLTSLLQTTVLHQYFHRCYRTGMRLNAACTCLIYSKSLKLAGPGRAADTSSTDQRQQRTSGEIVNLMSVDSQRIQDTMTYLHTLWSGPYQITITLIFLANVVGWATLAGLAVMLLQIPLLAVVSRRSKMAQRTLMKAKDERIKVTNEVFSAIRLLKMYGWEDSFQKRIDTNREAELKQLKKYQILNIISSAMMSTAPILTGVSTFSVYTAIHGELTAAVAFTSLSLFNVLRFPLAVFPNVVTSAVEANVALKRIADFLGSPQIQARPSPVLDLSEGASITESVKLAVQIERARLEWPNGRPLLEDVNLSIPAAVPSQERGHLTVVLGTVGVGKSGLLQALIGDLTPALGKITVNGTIAYTSQVAWIRNQTVKDNIIFNSDFNEERYQAVIKACALQPDLEALPSGETTEIGEKGVNISGGQKQRVSLARAVYAAPDILLLDDPLSAVDSEVAKKLLTMLRSPLLRMSSILLCTHHVAAVKHADQIVVLEKGGTPSMAHEDDTVEPPAGDSSQVAPARVAFCGSLEEFVAKYPEMVKQEQDFARQLTPEEAAVASQKPAGTSDKARLMEREVERVGSVPFQVYRTYMDAAGGPLLVAGVLFGVLFGQALQTGADSWVSFWSDHSSKQPGQVYVSSTTGILGYALMSLAAFVGIFSASGCFRLTALNAARWFHQQLLDRLLQQPMRFFDTTPLGRILNRFSKDIYTIDEQLQSTLYMYLQTLTRVFATVAVITFATPWFLVVIVPLLWVYRWTQNYYIPSSRQLKRIESSLRSPVFSHFSESLDGVASIRAFGQQSQFLAENADRVRRNMRAYYLNVSSNRWLAVRLETLGTGIVTSAGFCAVLARDTLSAGVAGLSISYALSVTQSLNWVVRMTSEREANIVSVERVREYVQLDCEPPHRLPDDPPQGVWPTQGCIEFKDVQLRYRQNLPLVLDGFSLRVEPREKLGICGRTGAGKSSVLNVLLRIVDPVAGRTEIDGVDIAALGLHRLRRSISIIPQEPVLFSGQLRFNLDPLAEASDGDIWKALHRAHLAKHVETLAALDGARCFDETRCLNAAVAEGGQNFSLGQRQQMCLARALIRSNRILLLDEATSAVDMETDSLIQDTIRKEFAQHTVLCIAHRISTIIESDRVCVVERGRIAELGAPRELLKVEGSRFQQLARFDGSA